jgi:hypothetical protein
VLVFEIWIQMGDHILEMLVRLKVKMKLESKKKL